MNNRTRAGIVGLVCVLAAGPAAAQTIALSPLPGATTLANPVAISNAGDGSNRLFFVLQAGRIVIHDGGGVLATPFLDIQTLVQAGGEQGLLGLAFHPNYPATPYLFVNYTCEMSAAQPECTSTGDTIIARFQVSANPNVADPASRRTLLVIPQPFSNHNAGDLKFGAEGYLYIPMGDGGSANDPSCFAQRDDSLLGKLLRIDVDQNVNTPPFYGIPPDNPYVGPGDPRDEVFARGLRNPFRFSFDRQTGDMFIGDVGQGAREEIDFQAAGTGAAANYGWKIMEGTLCTGSTGGCPGSVPPCNSPAFTPPILEVDHNSGDCAIIGGYRYRGTAVPAIADRYLYSDNCTGRIRAGRETSPGSWTGALLLDTPLAIAAFGEDEAGELYVASLGSATGAVNKIIGAPGVLNIGDATATEGDAGSTSALLTVSLSSPVAQQVTVQFATANGTATAGADYTATSGTLTFAPSTQTATVTVSVTGDVLDENDETFFVNLTNPVNAIIGDGQGVGTIADDDPLPLLSVAGCTVTEGNAGTTPCSFALTLAPASGRNVTLAYATADGTAIAGSDYTAAAGTLTFPPGATSRTVAVDVLGDLAPEGDEAFTLGLSSVVNAAGGGTATGSISDDDQRSSELAHGTTVSADLGGTLPVFYRMAQAPLASYEVVVDALSGDVVPGLTLDRVAADSTTVLQTSTTVGTGTARSLRWQNSNLAAVTDEQVRVDAPACGTSCGTDDVYRLRAYETTGAIPRFNNSGTQVTVVLLQNAGSTTVQGRIHFWNPAGGLITSLPFSLAPRATHVLQTATVPILQGASGTITVTSDAPFGALVGKGVALEPSTGFSFDSPMKQRAR
ncbi:MAG TPA: Calx-beta domain-containing protein [Vicinamibacteria bacterium]|nr:Calx-beta domain-containing protein [Vicinamibacteria bacterium]